MKVLIEPNSISWDEGFVELSRVILELLQYSVFAV